MMFRCDVIISKCRLRKPAVEFLQGSPELACDIPEAYRYGWVRWQKEQLTVAGSVLVLEPARWSWSLLPTITTALYLV
jgi:hypothetical protein